MDEDGQTVTLAMAFDEVDPVELVPPVRRVRRPDGARRGEGRVTLTIEGYAVTIQSTGTIAIDVPE